LPHEGTDGAGHTETPPISSPPSGDLPF
jgi:hypothetical protein